MTRRWWLKSGRWLVLIFADGVALLAFGTGRHDVGLAAFGAFWLGVAFMGFLVEAADNGWRS